MTENGWIELAVFIFGMFFAVIGYLLHARDEKQERDHAADISALHKSIDLLFLKHDTDVAALQELRERIAGRHYERGELDQKFEKLETAFKSGFSELGSKFDHLSNVLISHLTTEKIKQNP